MTTELDRANRRADLATTLIATAIAAGRWEAPIGWWGTERGSLDGMVVQDLEYLESHPGGTDDLYARCIDGADPSDYASWREYVDDLSASIR